MDAQPIESVRPWLGGRRYWLTAAAAILVLLLAALAHLLWVGSRTAAPQEAFVLGEWTLTPGQPASYRVFVRDASTGEPRPAADVELQLRADTRQDVRLLLEAGEGFELAGPASETLTVEANSVRGTSFRLVARRPGEATLLLRAYGREMADAIERFSRPAARPSLSSWRDSPKSTSTTCRPVTALY